MKIKFIDFVNEMIEWGKQNVSFGCVSKTWMPGTDKRGERRKRVIQNPNPGIL